MNSYIQDYSLLKIPHKGEFDEQGIPLFDPSVMRWDGGMCYHPTVVIQYALACWESRDNGYFESFVRCAKWVLDNALEGPHQSKVWYIPFPTRAPKTEAPWISALKQTQAISILLRYNTIVENSEIMNCIRAATIPLRKLLSDEGLLYQANGETFFEEAGDLHILNGCSTSLFGITEYLEFNGDPEMESILTEVVKTVECWLPDYDTGYWSRYSKRLRFNLADLHYHHLHVQQLKVLGFKLGSVIFLDYARKWHGYSLSPKNVLRFQVSRFFGLNFMRVLSIFRFNNLKYRS